MFKKYRIYPSTVFSDGQIYYKLQRRIFLFWFDVYYNSNLVSSYDKSYIVKEFNKIIKNETILELARKNIDYLP